MNRSVAVVLVGALVVPAVWANAQATKPLAYVRSLAVLPVRAAYVNVPVGDPLERSLQSLRPNAKAAAELASQRRDIQAAAPSAAQAALADGLTRLPGLKIVPADPIFSEKDLREAASRSGADAALEVTLDRCGLQAGLERMVWIRAVGRMVTATGTERGPFFGVGWSRASRKLIGKGYSRADEELVMLAARGAVAQMVRELRTGERAPFAAGGRALVVRAVVPKEIAKSAGTGTEPVRLPAVTRQSDVLFQPELSPVVEIVDPEEGDAALAALGKRPADLWTASGEPDRERLRALAVEAKVDYIFISRVVDLSEEESPLDVPDGPLLRAGVERRVDISVRGAVYSAGADRILWQDTVEGGTIARTEYARHRPRVRTDQQAVMDAANTAYAYLRYSFDEYTRRYSR